MPPSFNVGRCPRSRDASLMLARNALSNPLSNPAGRCNVKMTPRISRMASSISSTTSDTRSVVSGRFVEACRCSPAANSRWITLSCSSRAIRSRSSSTSSRVWPRPAVRRLDSLGDVSNRRDGCLDRSVEGAEGNFDRYLVARSMQRSQQQARFHRSRVRIGGAPFDRMHDRGNQRLDRSSDQLCRCPPDDLPSNARSRRGWHRR